MVSQMLAAWQIGESNCCTVFTPMMCWYQWGPGATVAGLAGCCLSGAACLHAGVRLDAPTHHKVQAIRPVHLSVGSSAGGTGLRQAPSADHVGTAEAREQVVHRTQPHVCGPGAAGSALLPPFLQARNRGCCGFGRFSRRVDTPTPNTKPIATSEAKRPPHQRPRRPRAAPDAMDRALMGRPAASLSR
jgi:hypothetical protein